MGGVSPVERAGLAKPKDSLSKDPRAVDLQRMDRGDDVSAESQNEGEVNMRGEDVPSDEKVANEQAAAAAGPQPPGEGTGVA